MSTVVVSVAQAFLFGRSLSMRPVRAAGMAPVAAFGVATAADTVSIAVMEVVDDLVTVGAPGAMTAGLGNGPLRAVAFAFPVRSTSG